jgi:hypothetical protein
MRENDLVREDVEQDKRGFSRVAAACENPARKCRVKWNKCTSPVGMTTVLTHTRLAPVEPVCCMALKGRGFSRAVKGQKRRGL